MMFTPERHLPISGQHGPAPSGTPPPAQPPPPPQTRETQSHSAPTSLKRPMLTPEGGPRPRVKRLGTWTLVRPQKGADARSTQGYHRSVGRRFRSVTKLTKLRKGGYGGVFLFLQQRSKHPREMVITPKASTSLFSLHLRQLCQV